jgi:hypothetical protein
MKVITKNLFPLSICLSTGFTVAGDVDAPNISGSVTTTAQTASDNRVHDEIQATADLEGELPLGPGSLNFHVEGNTTPNNDDGISALVGEANGDAGSALDGDDQGRLQVSELFYSFSLGEPTFSIGLIDPTANLDTDAIANDENTQFLAGPLINNPTIEFPDYTLGVSLDAEPENSGMGYHLFFGSSHGLGDTDNRDYSDLFDLGKKHKGIFVAGEGVWKTPALTARLGAWFNSSDHSSLGVSLENEPHQGNKNNYGFYGGLNGSIGAGNWSLRAGWADPNVSEAAWSIGSAIEYPVHSSAIAGFGIVHTAVSSDLGAEFDDNLLAELYLRFELDAHLQISPIFQYVRNPGFDNTEEVVDQDQWIAGLRLHVPF